MSSIKIHIYQRAQNKTTITNIKTSIIAKHQFLLLLSSQPRFFKDYSIMHFSLVFCARSSFNRYSSVILSISWTFDLAVQASWVVRAMIYCDYGLIGSLGFTGPMAGLFTAFAVKSFQLVFVSFVVFSLSFFGIALRFLWL